MGVTTRSRLIAALLAAALLACLPAAAAADPFLPPAGKVWNGLTAGFDAGDFERHAGKHPAVWQHFVAWGGSYQYTIENSRGANARLMYHLSTSKGQNLPERLSPGDIARGDGDGFLIALARDIADNGSPAYVRLMGEMNNCNNPYAAYSCSGGQARRATTPRRRSSGVEARRTCSCTAATSRRSTRARRAPAARGPERRADAGRAAGRVRVGADDGRRAEHRRAPPARSTGPGRKWVDWVGTSFYSRFPNFSGLERFYKDFAVGERKPFAIAEWAIWGSDAPGVRDRLFDWISSHRLVRMVQYNQGSQSGGIFRLSHYPASARMVRAGSPTRATSNSRPSSADHAVLRRRPPG